MTPWDRGACPRAISSARSEGRFTPPSLQGTLYMPFTGGGVNWGGLAVDGGKGVVYVNSSNMAHRITLFPAADYAQMKQRFPDKEVSPQRGAPYGMKRELLVSPLGLPCNPPPWGVLTALDLGSRKILWQAPLGTTEELNPLGIASRTGTPTFGGPLATASGLVFIAPRSTTICAPSTRRLAPSCGLAACPPPASPPRRAISGGAANLS